MLLLTKRLLLPFHVAPHRRATPRGRTSGLLLALLLLGACAKDQDAVPASLNKEARRQSAIDFYQALYSANPAPVDAYVAPGYVEHQVGAGFTLAGLQAYAQARAQALGGRRLLVRRTLAQGDLVCLHLEEPVAADSSVARLALLRFDAGGKITDHWEAVQGQPRRRANPNTMFDGAAVNYQSTAGSRGLAVAVAADLRAFNQYDTLIVRQTRTPNYLQHNPTAANGPDALIGLLIFLKTSGFRTTMTTHQQLAEGDFVMTMSNYQTTPAFPNFTNTIAFDLTRLTEDGKNAEHWDVLQELNGADNSKVF